MQRRVPLFATTYCDDPLCPGVRLQRFQRHAGVFQAELMHGKTNYRERTRLFREGEEDIDAEQPISVLRAFVSADMAALEQLPAAVDVQAFTKAVELLAGAPGILVAGQRRSFPAAAYLAYALSHLDHPVRLLDGLGGMLKEQVRSAGRLDVLVAISFWPYAPETREVIELARQRGLRVIALTDSPLSPLVQQADVWFDVRDAEVQGFRTLTRPCAWRSRWLWWRRDIDWNGCWRRL